MKKIKTTIVVVLIALLYMFLSSIGFPVFDDDLVDKVKDRTLYTTSIPSHEGVITIASFNIQTFGRSKRDKADVMEVLVNITCEFDVMAIQELRDNTETTMDVFSNLTNEECEREYVMSPRLGRSNSKENYAFIYNPNTVAFVEGYVLEEESDEFEREPYAAKFKAGSFEFVLVNIHIKPDNAEQEIEDLSESTSKIENYFDEDNVIFLGDMNADCAYFDEEDKRLYFKGYDWVIPNFADTTTRSTDCSYDRIIASHEAIGWYHGEKGVYNFDKVFNLKEELTFQVSDHYPVWANFKVKK